VCSGAGGCPSGPECTVSQAPPTRRAGCRLPGHAALELDTARALNRLNLIITYICRSVTISHQERTWPTLDCFKFLCTQSFKTFQNRKEPQCSSLLSQKSTIRFHPGQFRSPQPRPLLSQFQKKKNPNLSSTSQSTIWGQQPITVKYNFL
jgi:hypothetical protein